MVQRITVNGYAIEIHEESILIIQPSLDRDDAVLEFSLEQLPILIRQLRSLCPENPSTVRTRRFRERKNGTGEASNE